jgi:hypothetical protein
MDGVNKQPLCPSCRSPMILAKRLARSVPHLTFICSPCGVATLIGCRSKPSDDLDLIASLRTTVADALESAIRLSKLFSQGSERELFIELDDGAKQALLQRAVEATEAVAIFANQMARVLEDNGSGTPLRPN